LQQGISFFCACRDPSVKSGTNGQVQKKIGRAATAEGNAQIKVKSKNSKFKRIHIVRPYFIKYQLIQPNNLLFQTANYLCAWQQ